MNSSTKVFAAAASIAIALTLHTLSPSAPVAEGAPDIVEVQIAGANGVPQDATGAILNIAATRAVSRGYVTAWPCGQPQPTTSILNFVPGHAVSNSTVVAIGQDGKVCLSRSADSDLVIDVNGAFTSSSSYRAMNPLRVLDMRASGPTRAGSQVTLQIAGVGSVPSNATSAVLNITSARSAARGYVTAWPCDADRPTTSSLNFLAGANIANSATIDLSSSGSVCLWSNAETNLVVDVNGVFVGDGTPFTPYRLLDTRTGAPVQAGETVEVQVSNQPGVATNTTAAVLNIGIAKSADRGNVTAWPCSSAKPLATSLNFLTTPTSNTTLLGIGTSGRVCFSPSRTTDLVIDISGTFSASDGVVTFAPVRILDTRPRYIETFDTADSLDRLDIEVHHRDDHHGDDMRWAEGDYSKLTSTKTWGGDHDLSCGSPDSKRTLSAQDRDGSSYWCRQHMMTSMADVDGYSTIAFSPKQTFPTVSRVCWDQNVTDMGSRQWTELKVTPADSLVYMGHSHLASTGPGTLQIDPFAAQAVEGTLNLRFLPAYDGLRGWQSGQAETLRDPYYGRGDPEGLNSSAIRRQHCVTDIGNGQLRLTIDQGNSEYRKDFPGYFPPNARVVFEDHNYSPDKDGNANNRYTWHWDNLIIS